MPTKEDMVYMQLCLDLAAKAKSNGSTAVGAVIVRNGDVIAEGQEGDESLPPLLAHAEILAVVNAMQNLGTKDLGDCTLYTTVEPCLMCSYALREAKIKRVVFGTDAGLIGGIHGIHPVLKSSGVTRWPAEVVWEGGVLEDACRQLLKKT